MSDGRNGLQLRSLLKKSGELELSLVDIPTPEPGDDEVVVRVEATPLNPSDLGLLLGPADMRAQPLQHDPDAILVVSRCEAVIWIKQFVELEFEAFGCSDLEMTQDPAIDSFVEHPNRRVECAGSDRRKPPQRFGFARRRVVGPAGDGRVAGRTRIFERQHQPRDKIRLRLDLDVCDQIGQPARYFQRRNIETVALGVEVERPDTQQPTVGRQQWIQDLVGGAHLWSFPVGQQPQQSCSEYEFSSVHRDGKVRGGRRDLPVDRRFRELLDGKQQVAHNGCAAFQVVGDLPALSSGIGARGSGA